MNKIEAKELIPSYLVHTNSVPCSVQGLVHLHGIDRSFFDQIMGNVLRK